MTSKESEKVSIHIKQDGLRSARDLIAKSQCESAGWAYRPGLTQASTEATAWCAISQRHNIEIAKKASSFLVQTQNQDGGWSSDPGAGKSDWNTGTALLALRLLNKEHPDLKLDNSVKKALSYLLDQKAKVLSPLQRTLIAIVKGPESTQVPRGWPWMPDCYMWVEPTCYAMFGIKSPEKPTGKDWAKTLKLANEWLDTTNCEHGGWNHGSHFCLGVNLPPFTVTTCEALLALQDFKDSKSVDTGLKFLSTDSEAVEAGQGKTAMSLAWQVLAKHAYGLDTKKQLAELLKHQTADGSFGPNNMVTALAALALETRDNVNALKLTSSTT